MTYMRLFQYEWRKLASRPLLFCLLAVLLAGNIYLFYNQTQKQEYAPLSGSAYEQLLESCSHIDPEEALEEVQKLDSRLSIASFVNMIRDTGDTGMEGLSEEEAIQFMLDNSPFPMEYGDFITEYASYLGNPQKIAETFGALADLERQLKHIIQYPEYIRSMEKKRDEMKKASIFNKPGTFSYRNIEKTPEDFRGLESLPLSLGPENFLLAISTYLSADFCVILLLLLLCIYLFCQERENGLHRFIRSTRLGRFPVALSKLMVLLVCAVALWLLFYGTVMAIAVTVYDFGDLSRVIQSHSSFRGASVPMTVFQYLAVVLLGKLLLVISCALLFAVVFSLFSNIKTIVLLLGVFFAAEYTAYALIPLQSYLNILKYLNFFAYADSYSLFAEYYNINLFGFPVSRIASALCCLLFLILVLPILYFLCNGRSWNLTFSLPKLRGKKLRPVRGAASLSRQEGFKAFVSNKGWIFVAAALIAGVYSIDTSTLYMDFDNSVYWSYAELLEGPVDAEHEAILQKEEARFSNIGQEVQAAQSAYQEGTLSQQEYYSKIQELDSFDKRMEGFDKAKRQFEKLQALEEETSRELSFSNQLQYNYIFHNSFRSWITAVLFACLLILALSSFYPSDYQSGMDSLLRSMKDGRRRLMLYRMGYGALAAAGMLTILTIPHIITISAQYGWPDLSIPIQSIEGYGYLSWNLTVGWFLFFNLVLQYMTAVVLALVILAVSTFVKTQSLTILSCCILILFPLLLQLVGVSAMDWFTLNNGLVLFNGFDSHGFEENIMYYAVLLGVGIGSFSLIQKAFSPLK